MTILLIFGLVVLSLAFIVLFFMIIDAWDERNWGLVAFCSFCLFCAVYLVDILGSNLPATISDYNDMFRMVEHLPEMGNQIRGGMTIGDVNDFREAYFKLQIKSYQNNSTVE